MSSGGGRLSIGRKPVLSSGCYALMPTKEDALAELEHVFDTPAEYRKRTTPCHETRPKSRMPGARADEFRRAAARLTTDFSTEAWLARYEQLYGSLIAQSVRGQR